MQRRDFVAEAVFLMGLAAAPDIWASGGVRIGTETLSTTRTPAESRDEGAAVTRTISEFYSVFFQGRDKQKYRSLLTDDYLLLENGELMDAEADVALMPTAEDDADVWLLQTRQSNANTWPGGDWRACVRDVGSAGASHEHCPSPQA